MADRIGVINKGDWWWSRRRRADEEARQETATLHLLEPLTAIPQSSGWADPIKTAAASSNTPSKRARSVPGSPRCCAPGELGIAYKDLQTRQSSLEDIFLIS